MSVESDEQTRMKRIDDALAQMANEAQELGMYE
jgi:hypothetical protein